MRSRQLVSVILVFLLVFSLSTPAMAQAAEPDRGAVVRLHADVLEEKYDIRITYDTNGSGDPAIGQGTLAMMDATLETVTPQVVRQVSAYYQRTAGRKLAFSFSYTPFSQSRVAGVEVVGLFVKEYAQIYLLLPSSSAGAFASGAAPLTIAHEFAHALHAVCADTVGAQQLSREWRALNGGVSYHSGALLSGYDQTVFISEYAATSYDEDFAELFAHAFVRNKAGQGFAGQLLSGDGHTALGGKVLYLESLLQRVFPESETAVGNLHRAFSVPATMEYREMVLSGKDMQYIGFTGPLYVRRGILRSYGIAEQSYEWVSEIGGWQVEATDGTSYFVFPGGTVINLTARRQAAA